MSYYKWFWNWLMGPTAPAEFVDPGPLKPKGSYDKLTDEEYHQAYVDHAKKRAQERRKKLEYTKQQFNNSQNWQYLLEYDSKGYPWVKKIK